MVEKRPEHEEAAASLGRGGFVSQWETGSVLVVVTVVRVVTVSVVHVVGVTVVLDGLVAAVRAVGVVGVLVNFVISHTCDHTTTYAYIAIDA